MNAWARWRGLTRQERRLRRRAFLITAAVRVQLPLRRLDAVRPVGPVVGNCDPSGAELDMSIAIGHGLTPVVRAMRRRQRSSLPVGR